MTQTKLGSLYEVLINIAIGFVLSFVLGHFLYPLYGMPVTLGTNLQITIWFTFLSIARGYVIRRFFNAQLHKLAQKLAGEVNV